MKPLRLSVFSRLLCSLLFTLTFGSSCSAQAETGSHGPVFKFDSDVKQSLRKQVLEDFTFLESIQSTKQSPLHEEIFGRVDGENYLQWFNQRVFYFGVDDCGGPSAVACVSDAYANKIFVTNNYIKISHPQIARLMTVYHEARHTEFDHGMWAHALCPNNYPYRSIWTGGKLGGGYACDSTAYGSYSSASIMLNNVSKFCTNCSSKVKSDAKLYSDDQVKRVINASAIKQMKQDFLF